MDLREMAEELVLMSRRQHVGAVLLKTCIEDKLRAVYSQGVSDSAEIVANPINPDYASDEELKVRGRIASMIRALKPPSENNCAHCADGQNKSLGDRCDCICHKPPSEK